MNSKKCFDPLRWEQMLKSPILGQRTVPGIQCAISKPLWKE